MANDWIKMRVSIHKDPKVLFMADWLAKEPEFSKWIFPGIDDVTRYVTRNVTVALCVTGLLQIWGSAREQGERSGDDLVVKFCNADMVSDVTGVPKFGHAMVQVGWLSEGENNVVSFPKFFAEKENITERHGDKTASAERQKRYRDKRNALRNALRNENHNALRNGDVTKVTIREEKRREELNTPLPPFPENLNTNAFREAWELWEQHRKQIKKKLTPAAVQQQLKKLSEWGEVRAIAAIRHSVAGSYQGIFEEKTNGNGAHRGNGTTQPTVEEKRAAHEETMKRYEL